jgi:hypothetical protein
MALRANAARRAERVRGSKRRVVEVHDGNG